MVGRAEGKREITRARERACASIKSSRVKALLVTHRSFIGVVTFGKAKWTLIKMLF